MKNLSAATRFVKLGIKHTLTVTKRFEVELLKALIAVNSFEINFDELDLIIAAVDRIFKRLVRLLKRRSTQPCPVSRKE